MSTPKWTLADIPDQTGKVVVITGGNSGLGFETAKYFALKGANVIIASRSLSRGMTARDQILELHPAGMVSVMQLDLASLKSVAEFAERFTQSHSQLDVLVNNAGIMGGPYSITADGFESHLGVNHLGHFALTGQLLPTLLATPNARVVAVTSLAHLWGKGLPQALTNGSNRYKPMRAYGQSKLAILLFAYELQRKLEQHNLNCQAIAAHPGASFTNLGRYFEGTLFLRWFKPLIIRVLPKPHNAARAQLRAATDRNAKGGDFFGPTGFLQLGGSIKKLKSSKTSYDPELAQQLWKKSEELTGVRFHFNPQSVALKQKEEIRVES